MMMDTTTLQRWRAWQRERWAYVAIEQGWHLALALGLLRAAVWCTQRSNKVINAADVPPFVALVAVGLMTLWACQHQRGPWGLLKRWQESLQEQAYRIGRER